MKKTRLEENKEEAQSRRENEAQRQMKV